MSKVLRRNLFAATSLFAMAAAAGPAFAGAFALREQGAAGQGMSFAGVGAGSGGLSSMYWNPATITMNPGIQSYNSVSYIDVDSNIRPLPGTSPLLGFAPSGNLGEGAAVPASYKSIQINDRVWIGLSGNAPFGLVTKPEYNWSGQLYARTSRVYSVNFNPIIGIKLTDWMSIAVGPTIEYFQVKLKRATSFVPNAPTVELRGDDVDFGFTAGVNFTPWQGTSFGVGFRSSIQHDLIGRIRTPAALTQIKSDLNTPELITVGLTQAITNDLRLNLGYEFANWSRLGTVPQVAQSGPLAGNPINQLFLNYKDGHFASGGLEYDVSAQWTVRAGGAYEWSPITTAVRVPTIPDANRIWGSLGASYRWSDKITIDLAYTHIWAENARINITPGNPNLIVTPVPGVGAAVPLNFVAEGRGDVNIFSAALRYRWDDPKVAQPATVVRKY